jgi:hypothetical protein
MSWVNRIWSMITSSRLTLATAILLVGCKRCMAWGNPICALSLTAITAARGVLARKSSNRIIFIRLALAGFDRPLTPQAGPKIAAIASIMETCRRLDINLRDYLNDVLPKLGDWPITHVAELTPTTWKTAHQKTS